METPCLEALGDLTLSFSPTLYPVFPPTHYATLDIILSLKQVELILPSKLWTWDFPGGTVVKNLSANAGDTGLSPGPGRSHMPRSN